MSERTRRRLERILTAIPWVITHPESSTVSEVRRRFGYTLPELAADLDLVMMCGLPGYYPHDLIDAQIVDDHVVVEAADYFGFTRRLTPAEGLHLLGAALATEASGAGTPALRSAAAKLTAALIPDGAETVAVDLPDEPETLETLLAAIRDHTAVELTYRSLREDTTTVRVVEPWQAFSDLGSWYLDAHDHRSGEYRRFRIDRIRGVRVLDRTFERPDVLPATTATYQPGADDIRVVLELGPSARWVGEYYPVQVLADTGEALTVEFLAAGPAVAVRLLLRLGPAARLVEGDGVAEALAETRRTLLARYLENPDSGR